MKMYKTTYTELQTQTGAVRTRFKWDRTQATARARRQALKLEYGENIETKDMDIPTDAEGLLAWLNENVKGE